ncbi:MAG: peptidyl-prolyl cis-trans isomerase [Phycisphaeraceae bacterium]|nr:peptidyl-prolyl cis-trans isomerase [Phycisphaeraceae bacterium]
MRTQVHLKTAAIRSRRPAPFAAARILGGTVGLFFFAYPWLGGCSSEPIAPSRPRAQTLEWSAFVAADARSVPDVSVTPDLDLDADAEDAPLAQDLRTTSPTADRDVDLDPDPLLTVTATRPPPRVVDVTALMESPPSGRSAAGAPSSASAIVLESKVGQINGRPVLASEILEPLDGRLRALSLQVTDPNRWRTEATRIVAQQLWSRIRDELVLAEAQSNLTAQQRQGLFYFLEKLQQGLISTEGGSALQADEALRATTGRGLAEEARDRLDRELIENELRTKVSPRVNISWRQVRQEYDRRAEQFNPNPTVTFSLIRVDGSDAAAVERVRSALAGADTQAFLQVAQSADNQFQPENEGKISIELRGDLAQAQILAIEVLNNAARSLRVGETAGPLSSRPSRVEWIHFVERVEPRSISLYDAQLEIESALRERRFSAEMARYFDRLASRGSFSSIEQMGQSLMDIAIQRYMPEAAGR